MAFKAFGSWWSWDTIVGGLASWLTYYLFYLQPGVDRGACLRAMFDLVPGEPIVGLGILSFALIVALPAAILGGYWALYHFEWPFFEQYRVEHWDRIGWNDPDPQKRKAYNDLNRKSLVTFVPKQLLLLVLVGGYLLYLRAKGEWTAAKLQSDIDSVPDRWTSIWQIAAGLVLFETIFYWGHRVQHRWFYESHKVHHEYYIPNVLTAPWGADADGWLTLFLPGFLPPLLFGMHLWTFVMWTIIHYSHTYLDHSGYEFPWSPIQLIPLSNYVRAHDFHHTANVCNYGLYWRVWDWLMATDAAWLDHEAKRDLRVNAHFEANPNAGGTTAAAALPPKTAKAQ